MRILKFAVVAALLVLPVSEVRASVLGGSLSFDGSPDTLRDDSVGTFVDFGLAGGDGVVGTPDLVQGIISFPASSPVGQPSIFSETGGSLFAAYSFDLTGVASRNGAAASFDGSAASTAGTSALDLLKFGTGDSADFSGLIPRTAGTASIAVFELPGVEANAENFTNVAAPGAPLDLRFDGSADFSAFDVTLLAGLLGDDSHEIDLFIASPANPAFPNGLFSGAYTVLSDVFGAAVEFLELENDETGGFGDIIIESGGISAPDDDQTDAGFTFADSGNFQVNAVPEATSLLVWAGLGLIGLKAGRRSRRS